MQAPGEPSERNADRSVSGGDCCLLQEGTPPPSEGSGWVLKGVWSPDHETDRQGTMTVTPSLPSSARKWGRCSLVSPSVHAARTKG